MVELRKLRMRVHLVLKKVCTGSEPCSVIFNLRQHRFAFSRDSTAAQDSFHLAVAGHTRLVTFKKTTGLNQLLTTYDIAASYMPLSSCCEKANLLVS